MLVYSNNVSSIGFPLKNGTTVVIRGKNTSEIETIGAQFTKVTEAQWQEIKTRYAGNPVIAQGMIWAEENINEAKAHAKDAIQEITGQEALITDDVINEVKNASRRKNAV